MGTMLAQRPTSTMDSRPNQVASTFSIPRVVRCVQCGDLAREDARERVNEEEFAIRYTCMCCRWQTTRHYNENEM